ncbi:MAG: TlpA disulfide reductase family protein, partial [Bacteroidota bacterium]
MKIVFIVVLFACSLCIVHAQVKTITIDQLELALTSKEDTVFVVNFWATWCKPCIEELPYFEEAHKDFEQANVHVLLVSLDMPKELGKTLIPFIQKRNMHSEIVLLEAQDPNSWIDRIEP